MPIVGLRHLFAFCFLVSALSQTAFSAAPFAAESANDEAVLASLELADPIDMLFLQGNQQVVAFRHATEIVPSRILHASDQVLELQTSTRDLAGVEITNGGRELTLNEYLEEDRVAGFIVLRGTDILYEYYGLGNSAESLWISFSVAKSVTSMLLGAAIQDGYIRSVDDKVTDYLPLLKDSPYEDVSIEQLLQMSSGVAWNESYDSRDSDAVGADYRPLALYEHLRSKPRVAPAGERFNYSTGETNLVGDVVRSAIGNNLVTYLQHRVWQPFGMASEASWMLTEPGGGELGGGCISATLRDYARIGLFAMSDGQLPTGERVLPEGWMTASTRASSAYPGYGYQWWLGQDGSYRASGIFGQSIYVNPDRQIVIAVHSAWPEADPDERWKMRSAVFDAVVDSL